jgi:hypothetical protein
LEIVMHLLIWIVGLIVLMLWSAAMWLGYSMINFALTLPWDQATMAMKNIQIPELLKPFIDPILLIFAGDSWTAWVESLGPLMQWLGSLLQGSASWLAGALPVIAWIVWGLGALLLITLMAGGSAALWFFRKRASTSTGSSGLAQQR